MSEDKIFAEELLEKKHNEKFLQYYEEQGVLTDELKKVLKTNLPVVIRINNTRSSFPIVLDQFKKNPAWHPLLWFPGECVWETVDFRNYCDNVEFKKWSKKQNVGYTLRYQETVSLLSPLLLDLRPGERQTVLDMCAAPGSKTLESIEILQKLKNSTKLSSEFCIVANDANAVRAQRILSLILRKSCSPSVMITQSDGSKFPIIFENLGKDNDAKYEQFLFDRILADVPCSGDGTLRKNPHIWDTWTIQYPLELHTKQLKILLRGLHLLKENGRLVYSTCSLNPIENEAVVLAALQTYTTDIQLLDARALMNEMLPESVIWNSHPGLTDWKVPYEKCSEENNTLTFYSNKNEVVRDFPNFDQSKPSKGFILKPSMFANKNLENEEQFKDKLKKCMRIHPDQNNTGGFFIAVFTKSSHRSVPDDLINGERFDIAWRGRNPLNHYEFLDRNSKEWQAVCEFYGINDSLFDKENLVLVCEYNVNGNWTSINACSSEAAKVLRCKFQGKKVGPPLIFLGVPLFKKFDDDFVKFCPVRWRPTQEGGAILSTVMNKRVLRLEKRALKGLMETRSISVESLYQQTEANGLTGLDSCDDKVGPVLVGILSDEMHEDLWVPCIITGKQMMIFGRLSELQHVFVHL